MADHTTITDMVTLTIDGNTTTVPKGTLVIEAARQVGVMVPHFCYHPKLTPDANCRMCLVEIEKMPRLQTSCSTPVAEGMVVKSSSSTYAQDARKSVLDFILANHPLDCPVCDQGGRCDLQDFSHEYTATTSPFKELKRVFQKEYFSPLIETQMNRCHTTPGHTTSDNNFTLSVVECLGSCGTGPMMQVNDDYYEQLTEEKVYRVLDDLARDGDCSLKSGPYMFPLPLAKS